MDDELFAIGKIDEFRRLCISPLSISTIVESGVSNLGARGYFIYEVDDRPTGGGINVLAKVASLEAGFRLVDIWRSLGLETEQPDFS